jgi:hypothetical protein
MSADPLIAFDDWDPEVPPRWRDRYDWLSFRRWLRRPRTQIRNGYECQFEYRTGRWQFTHRLVAEAAMGCPIPPGYEVHHINGCKLDNRASNLAVIPRELHRAIHATARAAAANGRSYIHALLQAFEALGGQAADLMRNRANCATVDIATSLPPSSPAPATSHILTTSSTAALASILAARGFAETSGCPRCGGSGYLPEFSHVQGGVCFLCGGGGNYGGGDLDDDDNDEPLDDPEDDIGDYRDDGDWSGGDPGESFGWDDGDY